MGYVFPSEMFLVNSDLTPLEEHFDELVAGLTDWEPNMKEKGLIEPEMIEVKGDDTLDVSNKVANLFYRNLWSDSLPITAPSEEKVAWILTGTDRDPADVIGQIWPRGGVATVNAVAVALAMAGGRPEYMPVMLAITDILADPDFNTQSWNATTNSVLPAVIVNGPIAKQIRLGSGYSMFGPDPVHPAGQVIGRALRLILQDIGGATPGNGTMAVFGGMRSTNAVFAEDEEGVPEGWKTLAEAQGFTRDQNVITMTTVNGMQNVLWDFGGVDANLRSLRAMAGCMKAPNPNKFAGPIDISLLTDPRVSGGICVIPRGFATALLQDNGFDQAAVKQYLWENTAITYDDLASITFLGLEKFNPGDTIYASRTPEQITLVVGGGDQSGHGYWLAPCIMGVSCNRELELPAKWDDLLYEAEMDIGALPTTH